MQRARNQAPGDGSVGWAARARLGVPLPAFLLMIVLAVGGCGGEGPRSRMGRLTVWTSHNNEELQVFRRLADEFAEEFSHRRGRKLEIVLDRVPHEGLDTRIKSAALSRTTPDLCRIDVAHVAALAWGRAAVRLDTLPGSPFADLEKVKGRFVEAALASNLVGVPDGQGRLTHGLFGIPEQTNCLVLFRNRALFRERAEVIKAAGLDPERAPATWDELVRYGAALTDPGRGTAGFGMENTLWWSLPFLHSFGGAIFSEDPGMAYQVSLSAVSARKAYRFWVDLARRPFPIDARGVPLPMEGWTGATRQDPIREVVVEGGMWRSGTNKDRAFLEGRLAMVLSGPWNVATYKRRLPEVAASLVPQGPAGTSSTVGGNNLVMMPTCVDREAAVAFLDYVGSERYQEHWSRALSQIPTTRQALEKRRGEADAMLAVFMEQMQTARARPAMPNFDPAERIFQEEMGSALEGRRPVEESLERISRTLEREILRPIREAM